MRIWVGAALAACGLLASASIAQSACVTSDIAGAWVGYGSGYFTAARCRLVVAANSAIDDQKSACSYYEEVYEQGQPPRFILRMVKASGAVTLTNNIGCLFSASIRTLSNPPFIASAQTTMSQDKRQIVGFGFGYLQGRDEGDQLSFAAVKN